MKRLFSFIQHLRKHRYKYTILSVCLVFALLIFLVPDTTFAEAKDIKKVIAQVASFLVNMVVMFLWLVIALTSKLFSNEYIMGGHIGDILHMVWLVMRNLVNIGFVFLLLVGAFYMVINPGGEGNNIIKDKLPNFILAIILVNFSWLGMKLVLDASTIMTTAVFAIPQSVAVEEAQCWMARPPGSPVTETSEKEGTAGKVEEFGTNLEQTPCYDIESIKIIATDDTGIDGNIDLTTKLIKGEFKGESMTIKYGNIFEISYKSLGADGWFKAENALTVLATNLVSIQNLPIAAKSAKKLSNFTINTIVSLVMVFIVAVPIFVLFIVLIGRIVTLWLCICLMPITFIGFATQGQLTTSIIPGVEDMPDIFKMFMKNAFLPVFAAAPLSIGFLMLNAGISAKKKFGVEFMDIKMTFASPIAGVEDGQLLLWHILTAGVIWMGFFSAVKGQEAVGGIVEKIKGGAEQLGSWVGKFPFKYITFIPIAAGKPGAQKDMKFSLGDLYQLPSLISRRLETESRDRLAKLTGDKPVFGELSSATISRLKEIQKGDYSSIAPKNPKVQGQIKTHMENLSKATDPRKAHEILQQLNSTAGLNLTFKNAKEVKQAYEILYQPGGAYTHSESIESLEGSGFFQKVAEQGGASKVEINIPTKIKYGEIETKLNTINDSTEKTSMTTLINKQYNSGTGKKKTEITLTPSEQKKLSDFIKKHKLQDS